MKSAYITLGIPGNASLPDIEAALQRARSLYTPQRLADDSSIAEKFTEILDAYKLLRDPESREAHDRKLAQQLTQGSARRPAPTASGGATDRRPFPVLVVIVLLVMAIFATGFWMQHRRDKARAEFVANEAEAARQHAAEEADKRAAETAAQNEAARRDALAAQQEARLRRDSEISMSRLQANQAQERAVQARILEAERREVQRKEYEQRVDEQRRVAESQRRVALDRQRIRELCYQNYRRPDC